jgi:hypothetical protein
MDPTRICNSGKALKGLPPQSELMWYSAKLFYTQQTTMDRYYMTPADQQRDEQASLTWRRVVQEREASKPKQLQWGTATQVQTWATLKTQCLEAKAQKHANDERIKTVSEGLGLDSGLTGPKITGVVSASRFTAVQATTHGATAMAALAESQSAGRPQGAKGRRPSTASASGGRSSRVGPESQGDGFL